LSSLCRKSSFAYARSSTIMKPRSKATNGHAGSCTTPTLSINHMTGRERLNAVLQKQAKDRLPWTTLVDNATLSLLPEELRCNGGIDFYKHLDCDIFLLNGWNGNRPPNSHVQHIADSTLYARYSSLLSKKIE
jgi:hypothetical protein